MIATVRLVDTFITSLSYKYSFVVRTFICIFVATFTYAVE